MQTTRLTKLLGGIALATGMLVACSTPLAVLAADNEYTGALTALANGQLREIAQNPVIVAAVAAQNAATAGYDQARIDALDTQWKGEVSAEVKPLIAATLGTEASKWLSGQQDASGGLFTEIFVMDAKGLNVAQSTVTSDYWQGDEDKFTQSFGAGASAINFGEIEQDESTQAFQSQVSITITDPATGAPIGAVTAGVALDAL